ncbi:gamma-glutamylcyclotransferase family protein [Spirosoma jeollabukense]
MATDSDLLFVYGTLRPSFTNTHAQYLHKHSQYVGDGKFWGQLFDLGNYPGAIYQPETTAVVYGSIFNISANKPHLLTYLDNYEGIGEAFEKPHEYIRTVIEVSFGDGIVACWIYLYNLSVGGNQLITSGDYVAFLGI